jgi:mono/diheme cytochrome c family protein
MRNLKLIISTGALAFVAACGNSGPANTATNDLAGNTAKNENVATTTTPRASLGDELASGKALFEQNCAGCHKEDGTGGKITIEGKTIDPDNLTSEKLKKFDDAKIAKYIHDGVEDEGMPAFKKKLSDAQIREVVIYIRSGIQKMPLSGQKGTANQ